jgi:hypothetical protein
VILIFLRVIFRFRTGNVFCLLRFLSSLSHISFNATEYHVNVTYASCLMIYPGLSTTTQPGTPGKSEVMFVVLEISRARGRIKDDIVKAVPIGKSFAFTDTQLFTACHNVLFEQTCLQEIGVVQEYEDPLLMENVLALH